MKSLCTQSKAAVRNLPYYLPLWLVGPVSFLAPFVATAVFFFLTALLTRIPFVRGRATMLEYVLLGPVIMTVVFGASVVLLSRVSPAQ